LEQLQAKLNENYGVAEAPPFDHELWYSEWIKALGEEQVLPKRQPIQWESVDAVREDMSLMTAREKAEQAMLFDRVYQAAARAVELLPTDTAIESEHEDLQLASDLLEEAREFLTDPEILLEQITVICPAGPDSPDAMVEDAVDAVTTAKASPRVKMSFEERVFANNVLGMDLKGFLERFKAFAEVRASVYELQLALQSNSPVPATEENIIGYDHLRKPVYIGDRTKETPPLPRHLRNREFVDNRSVLSGNNRLPKNFAFVFDAAALAAGEMDKQAERKARYLAAFPQGKTGKTVKPSLAAMTAVMKSSGISSLKN